MANETQQHKWNSSVAFLMAMIGSAVGLGNIWRFSYVLYSNGGGAFFIPYFIAILIMGIPFLILEYSAGFNFKRSFTGVLKKINPKLEVIGWILLLLVFGICCYYMVIVGWDIVYLIASPFKAWGANPQAFFTTYVGGGSNISEITRIIVPTLIALIAIWFILWFISRKSIDEGIGRASKILIPILFVIMAIIIGYSLTLPGHEIGLNSLLNPDWSSLGRVDIWLAAFSQIVFSLSMGQGIALTYASYLKDDARIADYVLLVVGANAGFEICTAFGVFSILGYMSYLSGVPVANLVSEGTSLVFIVFPTIFDAMGWIGQILGPLFFIAILFAGITSGFGLLEPLAHGIAEKFNIKRSKSTLYLVIVGFCFSALFATGVGSYMVSIADSFINEFGILLLIVVQCIIFAWLYGTENLQALINRFSKFKVGKTWRFVVKFVLPIFLSYIWIRGAFSLISSSNSFELIIDLIITILIVGASVYFTKRELLSD